jgi:hypothetical protein
MVNRKRTFEAVLELLVLVLLLAVVLVRVNPECKVEIDTTVRDHHDMVLEKTTGSYIQTSRSQRPLF